ncbi:MAG: CPXCG motif-containing cysteine-rich protein [Tepidisphaeraceae bacterium]
MKRPKRRRPRSADEGAYVCPTCGERIVIPLDRSAGMEQAYGEDCPVCCNPNLIHVEFDDHAGDADAADNAPAPARVWAEAE